MKLLDVVALIEDLPALNLYKGQVLTIVEVFKGQFGSDSNEAQSIGLKKKSDRKRPTRQKATAIAS